MNNRTKIIIGAVIIALVFGVCGYYLGKSRNRQFDRLSKVGQMNNRRPNNNFIVGNIVSKDDKGITVKLANGSTQIILVSPSTEVTKMSSTSQASLIIGKSISINGKTNSDGSLTATSIQLRPEPMAPMPEIDKPIMD